LTDRIKSVIIKVQTRKENKAMTDYEIREALEWGCSVEEILEKIEKEG
jgi:alkylhydroperoxidase/carboxymuconolactone decarboxylase family protein YurZ